MFRKAESANLDKNKQETITKMAAEFTNVKNNCG